MSVDGNYVADRNILNEMDNTVVEIGTNPMNLHLFIDMATGQAVESAEIATVIGDRAYAKGVKYMKKADAPAPKKASDGTELPSEVRYKMNKGGLVTALH
jgi:folate-dependent phosphoribosylglycinamide formyltransferase PurN